MSISLKVAVPQIDLSQPARRLSHPLADGVSHELPSRTTISVIGATSVFVMHSTSTSPEDFPTAGDVLANGTLVTSTSPLVLSTSELDQPSRPNADEYWLAAVTGPGTGDVRVIG